MFASADAPTYMRFTTTIALYLSEMGLINPLGTAIALHPFGRQTGLVSALLGFLEMSCVAIGAPFASMLPLAPFTSLAVVLTTGSGLALVAFLPVALATLKRKGVALTARDLPPLKWPSLKYCFRMEEEIGGLKGRSRRHGASNDRCSHLLRGIQNNETTAVRARLYRSIQSIFSSAAGCAIAASMSTWIVFWSLALPVAVGASSAIIRQVD